MREESKKWFERALKDLKDGEFNLKAKRINVAVFLFQQAVEKALKALQIEKLNKFEKTHDLVKLSKSLDAPGKIINAAEKINPIYTISRYPDAEEVIELNEAKEILKLSKMVIKWVEKQIKK